MGGTWLDVPGKLLALHRLADDEPGVHDLSATGGDRLVRHGLVVVAYEADGRRYTISAAGRALSDGHLADGAALRSANPARPGHGIAVVYGYRRAHSPRARCALVVGFDDEPDEDGGEVVLQEAPHLTGRLRRQARDRVGGGRRRREELTDVL